MASSSQIVREDNQILSSGMRRAGHECCLHTGLHQCPANRLGDRLLTARVVSPPVGGKQGSPGDAQSPTHGAIRQIKHAGDVRMSANENQRSR